MDQHVIGPNGLRQGRGYSPLPARLDSPLMLFIILVVLTVFSGCSRPDDGNPVPAGPRATNQPSFTGLGTITIVPNPMTRMEPLMVSIEKGRAQEGALLYRYQWFVNKIAVQGATASSFDTSALRRGDRVHVVVTLSSVKGGDASFQTSAVTVPNASPVIQHVMLEQESTSAGSRLLATIDAFDADQDDMEFKFRWLRNDTVVLEGSERTAVLPDLAKNDIVTVEATAYDHDGPGKPFRARPLVVGNNSPKILSAPMMMATAELYEYTVRAEDPDGDPVSYELEGAPNGMTIDPAAGRVVWRPAAGINGTHHVKIIATDGKGARAWQEFDLSVPTTRSQ